MWSKVEWTGIAMVEFKIGDAGPQLMEINGRIWGSLPLATRAGMDFRFSWPSSSCPRPTVRTAAPRAPRS